MKPRDRRQFAAVSRAVTPTARADALRTVLARLGRWREVVLPLDHVWMAPVHVLADAAVHARVRSDRLVVGLTEGRLILEAGVDWDARGEGLRALAVLFRRLRLEWRSAVLELTFDGRPAPTGTPPAFRNLHLVARTPDGIVLCDARRVVWLDAEGTPGPAVHPYRGGPVGRFALGLLARMLAVHPPLAVHPVREAIQRAPSEENWLVYGDWLQAQGDPLGDAVAQGEGDPFRTASPLLAAWLASPRADLLRFGLEWHRGHVVSARIEDASGPPLAVLTRALLDAPEGALLGILSVNSFQVEGQTLLSVIAARPRPALRQLSVRCPGLVSDLPDPAGCPGLTALELHVTQVARIHGAYPSLRALALPAHPATASVAIDLPALTALDLDVSSGVRVARAVLAGAPAVRRLTLRNGTLDSAAFAHLMPALVGVRRLHLFRCDLVDPAPLTELASAGVRLWISAPESPVPAGLVAALGDRLRLDAPDPDALWAE